MDLLRGARQAVDALAGGDAGLDLGAPLPAWYAQAACRTADPEMFFPEKGRTPEAAKAICATCPVIDACLDHALTLEGNTDRSHRYGVWGGVSPKERARMVLQKTG